MHLGTRLKVPVIAADNEHQMVILKPQKSAWRDIKANAIHQGEGGMLILRDIRILFGRGLHDELPVVVYELEFFTLDRHLAFHLNAADGESFGLLGHRRHEIFPALGKIKINIFVSEKPLKAFSVVAGCSLLR